MNQPRFGNSAGAPANENQAEREVKAFEELHKDYEPTTPA